MSDMDSDGMFHFLFVFLLLAACIARGLHWYAARSLPHRLTRNPDHGLALFATVVMLGQALVLLTLSSVMQPGTMEMFSIPLPLPLRWIGSIAGIAGIGLFFWQQATLVGDMLRPRRLLAHPEYVAVGLLLAGTVLLTANWMLSALGILFLAGMLSSPTPLLPAEHRSVSQKILSALRVR